jgi:hypothetical protein
VKSGGHQQHAAAFSLHLPQVFQAFDPYLRADAVDAAPPGADALEHAHAQRIETVAHQALAPGFVLLGEAQLQVDFGGAAAAAEQAPGDPADAPAQRALQHPRQAGDGEGAEHGGEHRPVAGSRSDGRTAVVASDMGPFYQGGRVSFPGAPVSLPHA